MPDRFRAYHPVFHASKLAPYQDPVIIGQREEPPEPETVNGNPVWEVKKILQHRIRGRKTEYLVRWKGFTRAEDSWQTTADLSGAKQKIAEYKKLGRAPI